MGDLQATIEFSIELYKFFNVDLFQRGLYQVRCGLRVSPRLSVQIETAIPETAANGQPTAPPLISANCINAELNNGSILRGTISTVSTTPTIATSVSTNSTISSLLQPSAPPPSSSSISNSSTTNGHNLHLRGNQLNEEQQHQQQQQHHEQQSDLLLNNSSNNSNNVQILTNSASIINGVGASRVFQILYRNEEISLRDVIYFRTHLLVDSRHLKESIERAEFSLQLELWFAEQNCLTNNLTLVSTRTLQLNFHPGHGLHYHLPVLFDYFHLAAISVGIHASLVALHQPYINAPKNSKPWITGSKLSCRGNMSPGPLEAVFFSPQISTTTKCSGGSTIRLLQTRQLYREICSLLLKSTENLKITLNEFSSVLPPNINTQIGLSHLRECDSNERLQKLLEQTQMHESEEDFIQRANSDIAQLCAECIMLWRRVLIASTQPSIHTLLAKKHHILRVKRFSEGFFVSENPRHMAAGSYDNNYQTYVAIAEMARRSRYLQHLPPLPVHCSPIDGDANALPLIFEDRYIELNKFPRKRIGSDPYLNHCDHLNKDQKKSSFQTVIPINGRKFNGKECSCGINYDYISKNHCFGDGDGDIIQASLTLTPTAEININDDSIDQHFTILPGRHSKSLDQLDNKVGNKITAKYNKLQQNFYNTKEELIENGVQQFNGDSKYNGVTLNQSESETNMKHKTKTENLMHNVSELKVKYKNFNGISAKAYENQFYNEKNACRKITPSNCHSNNTLEHHISTPNQNVGKFDYLHEIKLLNTPKQFTNINHSYYNSLPKSMTNGEIARASTNSQLLHNRITPGGLLWPQKITITRSNSSQTLKKKVNNSNTIPRSVEIARVRVSDIKEMLKNGNLRKESSSSESDIPSKVKKAKKEPKMLSSNSVPYKLDSTTIIQGDMEENTSVFSESLPNLGLHALTPHQFINAAGNLSNSTSTMSEESGWVSSRYSSMDPSSPDTLTINDEKKLRPKEVNHIETRLNGEQLRLKLQKLLEQRNKTKRHKENMLNRKPNVLTSSDVLTQKRFTVNGKLKNERRITKSIFYNESTEVDDSDRYCTSTIDRFKKSEKSRSNIDLTGLKENCVNNNNVTGVRVPPPQQFQDDLLPPDEFRDPPALDNIRKVLRSHSNVNERKKLQLNSCNVSPVKALILKPSKCTGQTTSYQNTITNSSPSFKLPPVPPPPPLVLTEMANLHVMNLRQTIRSIDNPIYHVYESIKSVQTMSPLNSKQVIRSHSVIEMERTKEAMTSAHQNYTSINQFHNANSYMANELNQVSCQSVQSNNIITSSHGKENKENSKGYKTFCINKSKKRDSIARLNVNNEASDKVITKVQFEKHREEFLKHLKYNGSLYSDFSKLYSELPYFYISDEYRPFSPNGMHLIICVHGLDGNAADLRLVRTYLELGLPGANLEFLMSERNQGDTFSDFDTMTDRLVAEILYHIETCGLNPNRISFVAHSLGTIIVRSALARPQMRSLLPRLHTFLSLSGPHLGTLYNTSGLVNMGMWFMQKWKKSGSLLQLCMRDTADLRKSFLYRLSQHSTLHHFKNILLCGSSQDRYVPAHSARLELCKAAIRDNSNLGTIYREMVHNVIAPVLARPELTLIRYDVHHALPHTANTLIGRAAHIAVLDSELFIEKFLLISGLKYFS